MSARDLKMVTITGRNKATVQWDMRDLSDAIRMMERETKYGLPRILFMATKVWTERAAAVTKLAPKKIRTHWRYIKAAKKYVRAKEAKEKPVRSRGYARLSWKFARAKLGAQTKDEGLYTGGNAKRRGHAVNKARRTFNPYIEIASTVPYILELDSKYQIATKAGNNAVIKMAQMLERHAQRMLR